MIDGNERGQEKMVDLSLARDTFNWTDWEMEFLDSVEGREYSTLSNKQQNTIGKLWDKAQRG